MPETSADHPWPFEHLPALLASGPNHEKRMSFVETLGIACVLFATTNVDDIFVLLGFFADRQFKARQVIAGQYLGIGALFGVSVVASLVSLVVAPAYVGLLGLVPVGLGLKKLWDLRKGDEGEDAPDSVSAGRGKVLAIALVTIANGGDNISVYTPIFATYSGGVLALVGAVFAVMTAVWLGFAYWLTNHRTFGEPIRRYGHRLMPFVLITLGIYILFHAKSFELLF